MNMNDFKKNVSPKLLGYKLIYSIYPNGDFGTLERIEIEGKDKIANVDIWSNGWLDIDIYDLTTDQSVMNVLLDPTETAKQEEAIKKLLEILL